MKFIPMSPLRTDTLPKGEEWGYQLKWDGYRAISYIGQDHIFLYSKSMNDMTQHYPEIIKALTKLPFQWIADGEIVMMNSEALRPDFQMLQNRNKRKTGEEVQYIIFDLLELDGQDLRQTDFTTRHRMLQEIGEHFEAPLFTTDVWDDGEALWQWVQANEWEGVVSKRLSSTYREGKQHHDWYKQKIQIVVDAEVVGFLYRSGRLASLVLRKDSQDFGRVSAGLTQLIKSHLAALPIWQVETIHEQNQEQVHWLKTPLAARVTGTEITDQGMLRHPKLYMLEGVRL